MTQCTSAVPTSPVDTSTNSAPGMACGAPARTSIVVCATNAAAADTTTTRRSRLNTPTNTRSVNAPSVCSVYAIGAVTRTRWNTNRNAMSGTPVAKPSRRSERGRRTPTASVASATIAKPAIAGRAVGLCSASASVSHSVADAVRSAYTYTATRGRAGDRARLR